MNDMCRDELSRKVCGWLVRGRIAAVEDDMRQTYTVKHIRKGLTLLSYDLLSDNYRSRPRNPRIAELFRSCGMIEQYGSGIKRILAACERHRGVKATFEDHGDWFLAVLRKTPGSEVARGGTLNGTLSGTLNASDRRVLEYIDANPGCRASAIIAETSIPRDTLNKIIARLAKSGKVERRGSKKTGGYYKLGPFL